MDITITATVIASISTIVGGFIGYYIKSFLNRKEELSSEITKERRNHYQKFVDLIIDLFSQDRTGAKKKSSSDINKDLYTFYKSYILYASPDVIRKLSDFFQDLYKDSSALGAVGFDAKNFKRFTSILKAMRKDLGLSNKKLGKDGEEILRAMISDFDKVMKK